MNTSIWITIGVSLGLALLSALIAALVAVGAWAFNRLVTQLDQVSANSQKNTEHIQRNEDQLERHEAWHMIKGDKNIPTHGGE